MRLEIDTSISCQNRIRLNTSYIASNASGRRKRTLPKVIGACATYKIDTFVFEYYNIAVKNSQGSVVAITLNPETQSLIK